VVVRRDDLPRPASWMPLRVGEGPQDAFDRCIELVDDGFAEEARVRRSAFLSIAGSVGSFAAVARSEEDARIGFEAVQDAVVPCLAEAFEAPELSGAEVLEAVDAPVGTYEAAVLARSIPLRVSIGSTTRTSRFDVFAVHRGRTVLLLFFLADTVFTPAGEDDVLAAVAARMGIERTKPPG
jgi:hypothetical protein